VGGGSMDTRFIGTYLYFFQNIVCFKILTMLSLKQAVGEQIRKTSGNIGGGTAELSELRGCEVLLLDVVDFVEAESLTDTRVVVGACRSMTVRDCHGCTIAACGAQIIAKDCTECTFYLYVGTDARHFINCVSNVLFYVVESGALTSYYRSILVPIHALVTGMPFFFIYRTQPTTPSILNLPVRKATRPKAPPSSGAAVWRSRPSTRRTQARGSTS
jgi:hypothetical protein